MSILKADGFPNPPDVVNDNCVDGDDDGCYYSDNNDVYYLSAVIDAPLEADTSYVIVVHGYDTGESGKFLLDFTCSKFIHVTCWTSIFIQQLLK